MVWVLLCGTLAPGMPENFYSVIIEKIRKKKGDVLFGLDADGDFLKYGISSVPELIKPNISELERLSLYKINNLRQLKKAGEKLLKSGIQFVLVTMGGNGAAGFSSEGFFYTRGPFIKNAGCVGCGDVFLAGFVLSFSQTKDFKKSLKYATAAATAKAAERFIDIPDPVKVNKILRKTIIRNLDDLDEKIEISSLREMPVQVSA